MTIIIFIIILTVLVLVHEFGHFIVAKSFGIRVDEFGLGFPPKIWSRKWGETLYSLNVIPFGGFVKIFGEDLDAPMSDIGGDNDNDKSRSFQHRPKWIQALVLVAGVAFNIIFAWLIISFLEHSIVFGSIDTFNIIKETTIGLIKFIGNIFLGQSDFSQVAGPIGIARIVGQAQSLGFAPLLSLVALISINLAVINLVPFPALDGGRLLIVLIEAIIHRPISPGIVRWVNAISFVLLIVLMITVTVHDILKL